MKRGSRRFTLYASILGQGFALARNVIVARLLGPEEFGLAAAIILTVTFMESFSSAGAHNFLVQAKEDDDKLLSTFHAITSMRGVLTAALLASLAWPLSKVVGFGQIQNSLYVVAAAALASGFAHGGVKYAQRFGDFRKDATTQVLADLTSLVAAAAVALATHSHVAIAYALLARSLMLVAVSHLLAGRPYVMSWERAQLSRFWTFGWPLLINGPLLFLSAQADRLFISFELGAAALGIYSATLVLIMSPANALLRGLGTMSIPAMAKSFHAKGHLRAEGPVYTYTAAMVLLGLAMFAGFACFGKQIVGLLYGARYETTMQLVLLIGALQVVRFLRAWPSTLALSSAASGGILLSTVIRLISLPIGYLGLVLGGGLPGLILGFIVGELAALLIGLATANHNANRPLLAGGLTIGLMVGIFGLVASGVWLVGESLTLLAAIFAATLLIGGPILALSISLSETLILADRVRGRIRR